jgi:hypothetical protein
VEGGYNIDCTMEWPSEDPECDDNLADVSAEKTGA